MIDENEKIVELPLSVLRLIDAAYLPTNTNKIRTARQDVIQAVRRVKTILAKYDMINTGD